LPCGKPKRRKFYRSQNSYVRSATAKVAVERLSDPHAVRCPFLLKQTVRCHQHARKAIAALARLEFIKSL
jgi:Fe-S-cluster containining protein